MKGDLAGIARARGAQPRDPAQHQTESCLCLHYNVIGIPIAAGALYPAFGLLLDPMMAALAMPLSFVSVIANALRLRSLSFST